MLLHARFLRGGEEERCYDAIADYKHVVEKECQKALPYMESLLNPTLVNLLRR